MDIVARKAQEEICRAHEGDSFTERHRVTRKRIKVYFWSQFLKTKSSILGITSDHLFLAIFFAYAFPFRTA